jgi:hypothetical protein
MKKSLVFHMITLLLLCCLFITSIYGWWIEGALGSSLIIKSARIESEITLYKGEDFNYDGNLDKSLSGQEYIDIYNLVDKKIKNNRQILVLEFNDLLPTEIHTWKILVENKGDAVGYIYATLFTGLTDQQEKLVKYMSISMEEVFIHYITDGEFNGTKEELIGGNTGTATGEKITHNGVECDVYVDEAGNEYFLCVEMYKVFLIDAIENPSSTILFGGTEHDKVDINSSKEFVFQITLESIDSLKAAGIEVNEAEYKNLQGVTTGDDASFEFLDVTISSAIPK